MEGRGCGFEAPDGPESESLPLPIGAKSRDSILRYAENAPTTNICRDRGRAGPAFRAALAAHSPVTVRRWKDQQGAGIPIVLLTSEAPMDFFPTPSRWTFETVSDHVRRRSFWMEALGACLVVLGVLALSSVVVASFASTLLFGGILLLAGTAQIAAAFMYWRRREDGFVLGILLGCLCAIAGMLCLTDPARSMETLTFVLAGYFIASGVFRLMLVMNNRFPGWGWGVVSAGGEILLGILTFAA